MKPVVVKANFEDDEDESLNALRTQLRTESDWIRLFPGKITISVKVEGGGDISLTVDSRMTVAKLKDAISHKIGGGMTGAKIRLRQMQSYAMKDQMTLAFFNIPDGATLQMVVKK